MCLAPMRRERGMIRRFTVLFAGAAMAALMPAIASMAWAAKRGPAPKGRHRRCASPTSRPTVDRPGSRGTR